MDWFPVWENLSTKKIAKKKAARSKGGDYITKIVRNLDTGGWMVWTRRR